MTEEPEIYPCPSAENWILLAQDFQELPVRTMSDIAWWVGRAMRRDRLGALGILSQYIRTIADGMRKLDTFALEGELKAKDDADERDCWLVRADYWEECSADHKADACRWLASGVERGVFEIEGVHDGQ